MHCFRNVLKKSHAKRLGRNSMLLSKTTVLIVVLTILGVWIVVNVARESHAEPTHDKRTPSATNGRAPFMLATTTRPLVPVPARDIAEFQRHFQPRLRSTPTELPQAYHSLSIHVLRVTGRNGCFLDDMLPDALSVMRTFLESDFGEEVYGEPPLCETRYGVRMMSLSIVNRLNGSAREAHDHQTLAALAELGVPLSEPVRLRSTNHTLREVLNDAVANFYLEKRELGWTAVAFASYLPPQRDWTNKFGQVFTFDDVVGKLLEGGFSRASCGGVHVLYALMFVYQADAHFALLTDSTRERLTDAIDSTMVQVIRNQNADGSWSIGWHEPRTATTGLVDDDDSRFLVTGHLGELLLSGPISDRVGDDILERAGRWILPELRIRLQGSFVEQVCPLAHALCFVRGIAENTDVGMTSGVRY